MKAQKQKKASERKDFYQFQIADIDKVDPQLAEEQELLKEEKILQHSEKLFMLLNESYSALYENKDSIYEQLSRVKNALEEITTIDSYFENYKNDCESARLIADDLAKGLQSYKSKIEFNPNRLEEILARLSSITALKKKLGRSIDEILEFKTEMERELDNIENLDEKIESKREQVEFEKTNYLKLCLELSEKRKGVARNVEKAVPEILAYLGMPRSRFKVALTFQDDPEGLISHQGKKYQGTAIGMDIAEFFLSTNEGEDVRPLAKVASGGEISRIMLALKSLLAKQGQIPVLIFDEIDIGISGRIAQAVGRKLFELSKFHQVICITHLPQIASMAEHHYFVDKIEKGGRTETKIRKLSANEKAEAIAKLLAGEEVSEAHLKSAQELLENAN